MESKRTTPTVFKDINHPTDLIRYLNDDAKRLANSEYIYHYTTLSSVIKIIKSKRWHLANAIDMNDKLELKNGDSAKWPNIFFSSFMTEDRENIGMWSMYAQPWEKGVMIAIPSNVVRKWIHSIREIEEISTLNYLPTGKKVQLSNYQITLACVVYTNTDALTNQTTIEKLCWSNVVNTQFRNASHMKELTGYIKDMAWSYEKEVRIRVEFINVEGFKRVSINIPDEVINSMIITASPLFEGDLLAELQTETEYQISTNLSRFSERLNIKSICRTCEFKQAINYSR